MGSGRARGSRPREQWRQTPFKSLLFCRCGAHVQQEEQRRGVRAKSGRSSVTPESASLPDRALALVPG